MRGYAERYCFVHLRYLCTATVEPQTERATFPLEAVQEQAASFNFKIKEYRSYILSLEFGYKDEQDLWRVLGLVGDGSRRYQGIPLPVHLKIFRLNQFAEPTEILYDGTISTTAYWAHAFHHDKSGHYERKIITANLAPGPYRAEIEVLENWDAFKGTPARFGVEIRPYLKFLPDAVTLDHTKNGNN